MTLHITPDMIEAAYELLKTTPPFRGWKLPPSDDVEFRVIKTEWNRGTFHRIGPDNAQPIISISSNCIGNLYTLLAVLAHEMVHLHEDTNHKARMDVMHSSKFKTFAHQVCKHHGFDEKLF